MAPSKEQKAESSSHNAASKWLDSRHKATRLRIIQLLDQKPERMDAVLDLLEKDIQPKRGVKRGDDEGDEFWKTLMRLQELPKKEFWKMLIVEACKARGWTQKQWQKIWSEKVALTRLGAYLFCIEWSWRIPKPMYSKKFAYEFMFAWANQHNLSDRVKRITLKPDGKVNWDLTGPFELVPEEGAPPSANAGSIIAYKKVRHVGGQEACGIASCTRHPSSVVALCRCVVDIPSSR